MKFASIFAALAVVASPLALPSMASAHTRVVASTPAEGATVAGTRTVTLTFNEALLPPHCCCQHRNDGDAGDGKSQSDGDPQFRHCLVKREQDHDPHAYQTFGEGQL